MNDNDKPVFRLKRPLLILCAALGAWVLIWAIVGAALWVVAGFLQ